MQTYTWLETRHAGLVPDINLFHAVQNEDYRAAHFFRALGADDSYLQPMTIWILALLLFGCLAGIGYQQGAIRVAISFVGIITAALLAGPLAKFAKPVVAAVGVVNPVLLWLIPPFVAYVIVLAIFKIIAIPVHRKVEVFYRYKAGDLRFSLWERLNSQIGLCLGLLNGLAYLVLLSMVIYPLSYWTVQMASPEEDANHTDPRILRIFNQMGRDLQSTGMARVARAIDPMPDVFYHAADVAGLIYQNPLLEARLSRYPAFLSLAERPEFKAIGQDRAFTEARLDHAPIKQVLQNPNVSAIVNNPATLKLIWSIASPNLNDLLKYLKEGTSDKYTEQILGRWYFDVNGTIGAYRRSKPNIASKEMQIIKKWMAGAFSKTMLVAAPDHKVVLRNIPQLKQQPGQPPSTETRTLEGQWKGKNGDYELVFGSGDDRNAKVESGLLVVTGEGLALVFTPED